MRGRAETAAEPLPLAGQLELVRPPAPGQLELVRAFVNTRDVEKKTDVLESAASFAAWLREHGLGDREKGREPTRGELQRAREVREELRALASRNNGLGATGETASLDRASERSRFVLSFDAAAGAAQLRPTASGVDGALGRILAAAYVAMAEHTWPRLKICADDECAWTFYDHSKNGCSRWCSAETCGNRSKVKRYRERQASARREGTEPEPAP